MGTFLLLSKSSATFWLHASEAALLGFGVLLVIGLTGEVKFPWPHPRFETFEFLVIIAVAGELLGDGGVFIFSGHLQTIADAELKAVVTDVGSSRTAAEKAADAAERANASANKAEGAASNALTLARSARQEADSFEGEIASAKKQLLMQGDREKLLSGEPRRIFVDSLKPFAGQKFGAQSITLIGGVNGLSTGNAPKAKEMDGLVQALTNALKDAGWNPLKTSSGFQGQKQVASPAARKAAKELTDAISKVPITGVSVEVEKDTIVLIVGPK